MAMFMNDARFSWCNMLLVFALAVISVKAQSSCNNTPRGESGMCVPYKKCGIINAQYERYGNSLPQSFVQEIKRRHCPQFKNDIYICCELRDLETAPETAKQPIQSVIADRYGNSNDGMNSSGLNVLMSMRCGMPPINRVSNAVPTALGEFPWMALIRYDSTEEFQCGGSLITERYVLTAGHCIIGQRFNVIGVRLGEYDISKPRDCQMRGAFEKCAPPVQDFGIDKIITHESYKGFKNDIALIRLDRNVECSPYVQPVCLPINITSREVQEDQEYFIAGWGLTENNVRSNILLKAKLPHQPLATCLKIYRKYAEDISDNHLCAGGRNRMDSCKGDSGGPLFFLAPYDNIQRMVQFGVVSFGVPACGPEKSYPTLFTKVAAHLPWITNKLAEYEHIKSKTCSK